MRHPIIVTLCVASALALTACEKGDEVDVERTMEKINVIDESNLNDIMLQAADPKEAVTYFRRTVADNPGRLDVMRGLGLSLTRAKLRTEAVAVWGDVVAHPESTNEDRINYADALIRNGNWEKAEVALDSVPPTFETYKRYRLEAMIADGDEDWKKADSFYEIAIGLTTQPSGTLNNWGYSKLSRGDYAGAEKLFGEALKYDSTMFTAKNNIVLARGAQRKYDLPIVPMTQVERAQLLHTMALAAIKQGDVMTGKSLLQQAIDTHPQYFEVAVRSMRALDGNQLN
jgi:Flp pilus assembly protein TadD